MQYFKVTDQELVLEIKKQTQKMCDVFNSFVNVSREYGFDGVFIDKNTRLDSPYDVYCRGFSPETRGQLTPEQNKKFKLVNKRSRAVPRLKFENEVKVKLGGYQFNYVYSMAGTWNKLVKKFSYFCTIENSVVHDGVHGCNILDNDVYLAIMATHEDANLNTDALQEITKAEYLSLSGE